MGNSLCGCKKMNKENVKTIKKNMGNEFYTISCVSITSSKLFKKIISSNHPQLKRWPKNIYLSQFYNCYLLYVFFSKGLDTQLIKNVIK